MWTLHIKLDDINQIWGATAFNTPGDGPAVIVPVKMLHELSDWEIGCLVRSLEPYAWIAHATMLMDQGRPEDFIDGGNMAPFRPRLFEVKGMDEDIDEFIAQVENLMPYPFVKGPDLETARAEVLHNAQREISSLRTERDTLWEALQEFLDFSERNDLPMILDCMTKYGLAACLRDSVHKNARAALDAGKELTNYVK